NCLQAVPNPAHAALARLNRTMGGRVMLVTQNIDDLLERSGATEVVHMHGELLRALCAACGHRWDAPAEMAPADPCPACGRAATRPDVVWFGEYPYHLDRIAAALAACETFVAIGTSGNVYPAAGFVHEAAAAGARTLELNLEASEIALDFDEARQGPASRIVPDWVDAVLAAQG
ncbi:MAG: NAD-dependent protein deacylase, partial [Mangrovicoccus sp.]|nr:NAD-dependent protein deacylase [Mangrovicoccus sp.]